MQLRFYNTLTRQKEDFKPLIAGKVRMYTCGPTVYDYAHIGNFRTYMFEDLLRRYLKYKGYQVIQVLNLTDVDDRTIRASQAEKLSLKEYTKKFEEAFFQDLNTLNIERAEVYPRATEHIKEMVELVKKLLEKGYAYKAEDGSTYFSIAKFKEYGKLSKMKLEDLKVGARVSSDEYEKEQASDFALWKAWDEKDGEVFWEKEIGKGRPGWHIECSAMSMKYLGEQFDIHTGGIDNMFPHHENEIAQSEAATGKKFVNYWLHSQHLIVEGQKMAKSLGNFYTVRDLLQKGYLPRAVRYLLISTHYRQQLNFTFEGLEAAKNALQRLDDFTDEIKDIKQNGSNPKTSELISKLKQEFEEGLDDDLNISQALAALFTYIKEINKLLTENKVFQSDAEEILKIFSGLDKVLGFLQKPQAELDEKAKELIAERERARSQNNWKLADEIRKMLYEMGIILEDTAEGTKWKKKY